MFRFDVSSLHATSKEVPLPPRCTRQRTNVKAVSWSPVNGTFTSAPNFCQQFCKFHSFFSKACGRKITCFIKKSEGFPTESGKEAAGLVGISAVVQGVVQQQMHPSFLKPAPKRSDHHRSSMPFASEGMNNPNFGRLQTWRMFFYGFHEGPCANSNSFEIVKLPHPTQQHRW